MTYQVLARKWRPQDFSSLIGQEAIVTALRNALSQERIAQAYVFSGIRGVGKTTAARVFAKALNCEGGEDPTRPTPDPCNECGPCRDITAGRDVDVQEIDAATYSKVEQVRELTESLRYGTARDRYKVVILDEVHRLSRQAFDALLKIVEEPPPHLVFLFATTELDAVPATVLSRCQEFQFRRVPSPVLAEHLRNISEAEKIEVSDASLRMIARSGEGSVRDSVALLDQMATFGDGAILDEDARRLLGGLDAAIFHKLLRGILEGDGAPVLEIVSEIEANGWDPHNVYSQFLGYLRMAVHLALGGEVEKVDLPKEEAQELAGIVKTASYEGLLRTTQNLLSAEPMIKRSEMSILATEIAWLRAAEMPKLVRIEDLLAGRAEANLSATALDRSPALERRMPSPAASKEVVRDVVPEATPIFPVEPTLIEPAARIEPAAQIPAAVESPKPTFSASGSIDDFLAEIGARRRPLKARLQKARLSFDEGVLKILADDATVKSAQRGKKIIEEVLAQVWGAGATFQTEISKEPIALSPVSDSPESSPRRAKPSRGAAPSKGAPRNAGREESRSTQALEVDEEIRTHPTVQSVLELFDGTIREVREEKLEAQEKREEAREEGEDSV